MSYEGSSYLVGSISGIPIRIHSLFLVALVVQVLSSVGQGVWQVLYYTLLLGPVLALTVLAHELGHCAATRQVGGEVHGVLLWPLGGLAYIGHSSGPKADMWVAAAGPLTHVPMTLGWLALLAAARKAAFGAFSLGGLAIPAPTAHTLLVAVCAGAVWVNITLFAFNLLVPAYPLDGGRLLADGLLLAGLQPRTAAWVTAGVAAPMAAGIVVWGAISYHPLTMLVGAWIGWATWELVRTIRRGELASHPLFAFDGSAGGGGGRGGYVLVGEGEEGGDPYHPPV